VPLAFSNTGRVHRAAPDHDANSFGFWQRPRYVTEEHKAAAGRGSTAFLSADACEALDEGFRTSRPTYVFTGLPAAMQLGNWPHTGNIADMDRTSTKWWVRLGQERSRSRVLRNRVRHSREQ
jgi:hypothetical protein